MFGLGAGRRSFGVRTGVSAWSACVRVKSSFSLNVDQSLSVEQNYCKEGEHIAPYRVP